jgi:hypothetical protein
MPIVRTCSTEGCSTLTMGEHCIDHEQSVPAVAFPRGRPLDLPSQMSTLAPDVLERGRTFQLLESAEQANAAAPAA